MDGVESLRVLFRKFVARGVLGEGSFGDGARFGGRVLLWGVVSEMVCDIFSSGRGSL